MRIRDIARRIRSQELSLPIVGFHGTVAVLKESFVLCS